MIVTAYYTTRELGVWKELKTDTVHQERIRRFLANLWVPLPTKCTIITHTMSGAPDQIVVHSFKFSEGAIWDAINGWRPVQTSLDSSYDRVHNDYSHEEKL